jgi:Family of unknown function (DUF6491)
MKNVLCAATLLCLLCGTAQAMSGQDNGPQAGERVDRIRLLSNIDGWRPIDNQSVIIWATAFKPYLVVLSRKSPDLRFANAIGVTSTAGDVYERFDSVIVDGLRYPIEAIYALDRDAARHMKAT